MATETVTLRFQGDSRDAVRAARALDDALGDVRSQTGKLDKAGRGAFSGFKTSTARKNVGQLERALRDVEDAAERTKKDLRDAFNARGDRSVRASRELGKALNAVDREAGKVRKDLKGAFDVDADKGVREAKRLDRALDDVDRRAGLTGRSIGSLGRTVGLLGGAAVLGGVYALGKAVRVGFGEFKDAQRVTAQTNAVIKSTGGVANVTAKQVDVLANAIARKSGMDDEAVKSGENMLLTFTNIRNEVGEGNDIFNQATSVLADMSTALGTDMSKSAIQLGKALNDPIKGVSALRRVGVSFTEQQQEQIKTLVASGKTMDAQKLILRELQKEFGGSAEAAGKTFGGQINILRERLNNFLGDLVGRALPSLQRFTGFLNQFSDASGFRAKVQVVFTGVDTLSRELAAAVQRAVQAAGRQVAAADWEKVGRDVGRQISAGLDVTSDAANRFVSSLIAGINAHRGEIAALGASIALEMVATLTSPAFWADHWREILAIGSVVLLPGIGRLAGSMVARVGTALATGFRTAGARAAAALLEGLARLPGGVGNLFLRAATSPALGRAARVLGGAFGRVAALIFRDLKGIPGVVVRAFAIGGIVAGIRAAGTGIASAFTGALRAGLNGIRGLVRALLIAPINAVIDRINRIKIKVPKKVLGVPIPGGGGTIDPIPHIPRFHTGGVVPGPLGAERLVLAQAGETIRTPAQERQLAGATYNVTINAPNYVGREEDLARVVAAQFDRFVQRNGRLPGRLSFQGG